MKMSVLAGFTVLVCVSALGMGALAGFPIGKARLTFCVVNEDGQPVPSASVRGYFENPRAPDYAGDIFDRRTDRNGETVAKGDVFGFVEGWVLCDGHYKTSYRFANPHAPTSQHPPYTWPDWVVTNTVVLKRIRNPVPMYMQTVDCGLLRIPAEERTLSYDMEKGGWLPPFGTGVTTDMVVRVEINRITNRKNGTIEEYDAVITIDFPRPGDGLIKSTRDKTESEYPMLYEAPSTGYEPHWTQYREKRRGVPMRTNRDKEAVYYMRLRTRLDEKGNVKVAWYGKLCGDFLDFTYYLNPDGTRNVEFDLERNLFGTNKR